MRPPYNIALTLSVALMLAVTGCSSDEPGAPATNAEVGTPPAVQAIEPIGSTDSGVGIPSIQTDPREPINLSSAEILTQRLTAPPTTISASGIGVFIGTHRGQSDGLLVIEVCQAGRCSSGETDLSVAADNDFVMAHLDSQFEIVANEALSITLSTRDASRAVAIWAYDIPTGETTSVERVNAEKAFEILENTSFRFKLI